MDGGAGNGEQQPRHKREGHTLLAGEIGGERPEDVVVELDGCRLDLLALRRV